MRKILKCAILGAFILSGQAAFASDPSSCDSALVKDTDFSTSMISIDYRLATLVTESIWNEHKTSASADAVLFDIPLGGTYEDYKKNTRDSLSQLDMSYQKQEIRQLAISRLSDNAAQSYATCIKSQNMAPGISLEVNKVTLKSISLIVRYVPFPAPNVRSTSLTWSGGKTFGNSKFPTTLAPNASAVVLVKRPDSLSEIITVQNGLSADQVEIFGPTPQVKVLKDYVLYINGVDDLFIANVAGNPSAIFQVGFGSSGHWSLFQYLKKGINQIQFDFRDLHIGPNGGPCWSYQYNIDKIFADGSTETLVEQHQASCVVGSQPPGPVPPVTLFR